MDKTISHLTRMYKEVLTNKWSSTLEPIRPSAKQIEGLILLSERLVGKIQYEPRIQLDEGNISFYWETASYNKRFYFDLGMDEDHLYYYYAELFQDGKPDIHWRDKMQMIMKDFPPEILAELN